MAFSYLEATDLFDAFNDSKKYMRPLFEPLTEFERIARNQPHPGIDKHYPKVTDGTTAAVIEKTPRRILQQIPTGSAHSPENDWLTHVAGFLLSDRIIPNANAQYPFLQKCQAALGKALTYGSQPAYIPFVNRGKYFGPDLLLPYIKDVFLEKGKLSDADSNYILLRAWYQPSDIKAIINREKNLSKSAEGRGDTYESGWDLEALAQIQNRISQKDDLSTTPTERDKNNREGGVEIVHAFQRGIGGTFFSFHMGNGKAADRQVLRTKTNKDPRGELPIHYLYAGVDMSNPLGRGFVEMAGAMQNLMDSEVQMYQYNRAMMLNPPMIKRGNWNKNQAKLMPNILVDVGNDQNATWEPVPIDNNALSNFASNYGLMQSQIYQLLSAPNANISADTGTQTFSKTQAGVKQQSANLNVDDNYIRNQTEAWLEKVFETQLNLYFAERTGIDTIQLDQDTANDIKDIDEGLVNDKNEIRVNYSSETDKLSFRIDPGSSEQKDDQDEIIQLKEIIADVNQNPYSIQYITQAGKQLQLGEVYKQLFERLGLENLDKILVDLPKDPQTGKPVQTTPPMAMDKPKLVINYDDVKSPTVKAALLNNAGIQADPNDIAQGEQMNAQLQAAAKAPAAPDQNDIMNHPIIKLMSSLQIKFTDLPEDSKQEVLQIIGIPSNQASPVQADQSLQAIDQAHQILQGHESQANQQAQMTQDSQQQAAQLAQADAHKQLDTGLQQQSQDQQAQQNQAQNQLQAQGQQQQAEQAQQAQAAPTSKASKRPSPPAKAQAQPIQPASGYSADDEAYLRELMKMGLSPQQAQQGLALIHHGYAPEDILKMIGVHHG